MARWQRMRSIRPSLGRPAGRSVAALLVGGAAVMVIALAAALALGTTTIGGDDEATHSSGEAVAPNGVASLRAPEEGFRGAPTAPSFDDAKDGDASPGAAQGGASEAASGAGGGGGPLPSVDAGRTIIRSAGVDIEVEAVADSFERIRQIATTLGGYVGDSTFSGSGERQSAYLTIRVPSERFGDAIAQIRALAVEVHTVSTSAHDVTEEYSDIEAMLRNLRAVEQQYVELLGRATSIGDVLQVQDRLNQVRLEIDRLEGRRQLLASQADLATIAVSLRPVGAGGPVVEAPRGPLDAAADAWQASLDTLALLATGVIVVVVYSWWILPMAVVLLLVARRLWRRREPVAATAASD